MLDSQILVFASPDLSRPSLLGTTRRSNGKLQVTYAGHPLYYVDDSPGAILCHDVAEFGGLWLVVEPMAKRRRGVLPLRSSRCEDLAVGDAEDKPVYALNLFDVADRKEYLAYSRRSAREVERHGGKVIALGQFSEALVGEIEPRQVLILVEWKSRAHFDGYREDPELADLHPHREAGGGHYVWHLFDKLEDLRPLLKPS